MPARQTDTSVSPSPTSPAEEPLIHEDYFIKLLGSVGINDAATMISEIFFARDVGDLQRLHRVLFVLAEGHVSKNQAKLIMPAWAVHWGVAYEHDDFFSG